VTVLHSQTTAVGQRWCTQSTDSRISAVGGWSCNKLLTLDCRRRRHVQSTR